MRLAINTAYGRGRPELLPAWRVGLTPLQWVQIGGNTISAVDPKNDAAINPNYPAAPPWDPFGTTITGITRNWSGGAWDEVRQRFSVFGGGHAGWLGNCGFSVSLDADDPSWVRRGYPTGSIQKPGSVQYVASGGWGVDGRPASTHTYNQLCALGDGNIFCGYSPVNWEPAAQPGPWEFNIDTGDYEDVTTYYASGAYAGLIGSGAQHGGVTYDPVRDKVWHVYGSGYVSYNAASKVYNGESYHSSAGFGSHSMLRYMPGFDIVVHFANISNSNGTGKSVLILDPTNPTAAPTAINATTQVWGGYPGAGGSGGVAVDSLRGRFLYWAGGSAVSTLDVPANPKVDPWTYGSITTSTAVVTPSNDAGNGIFGRFWYSKKYDCAFGFNEATERLYCLPLS